MYVGCDSYSSVPLFTEAKPSGDDNEQLEAAQRRIDELEIHQKEENAANRVLSAALDAANERLLKPVVLAAKFDVKMAGDKATKSMFYGRNSVIDEMAKLLKAAGFTVQDGE